jgi:hypothetical protein
MMRKLVWRAGLRIARSRPYSGGSKAKARRFVQPASSRFHCPIDMPCHQVQSRHNASKCFILFWRLVVTSYFIKCSPSFGFYSTAFPLRTGTQPYYIVQNSISRTTLALDYSFTIHTFHSRPVSSAHPSIIDGHSATHIK